MIPELWPRFPITKSSASPLTVIAVWLIRNVAPSKFKFDSPCIALALDAVITLLSAPLVIGKPPLKEVALTVPDTSKSPLISPPVAVTIPETLNPA